MKKIIFGMLAFTLIFTACKKEEVKNPETVAQDELNIEGKWEVKRANFLSNAAHWNDTVDYNEGNYFGHAPSMFELYLGFEFTNDEVSNGVGNKLNLYNTRVNLDPNNEYWYWNYTDNKKGFEMMQISPYSPPYNFSIVDIRDIDVLNDGNKMIFEADVYSRIPGEGMMTTQMLPVEITIERGAMEDSTTAEVFILDQPFQP